MGPKKEKSQLLQTNNPLITRILSESTWYQFASVLGQGIAAGGTAVKICCYDVVCAQICTDQDLIK